MLLSNANIWLGDSTREGHLFIDEKSGKIKKIFWKKPSFTEQYGENFNLKQNLVIPSLVDIHCHLRDFKESTKETFKTGAKAAAAGGFTHVFDMPNKKPPVISKKTINLIKEVSKNINLVEIIPYLLLNDRSEKPFVYEYPFLKAYLGETTGKYLTTLSDIEIFLRKSKAFLSVHCEDRELINVNETRMKDIVKDHCDIRDGKTEINSIQTLIQVKKKVYSQVGLHVAHVTLMQSVDLLKNEGVSFEVTPHHLLLNTEDYQKRGVWTKMNPPLRSKVEQEKILLGFLKGEIPIIATDHAPHTKEEKEKQFLSGVPGLETALPSLIHEIQPLDIKKLKLIINAFAINPRSLMNFQSKGIIAPGEIADLTVIDLDSMKRVSGNDLFTNCKWSPWEGIEMQGWPVLTIHEGKITFNNLQ